MKGKTMSFCTADTQPSTGFSKSTPTQRLHFATHQAIIYRSTAPLREKAFLQILATWADDHGQCFPSNEQIRRRANTPLSERTIQNLIGRCVALGELRVAVNASVRGTNIYTILCVLPDYAPRPMAKREGGAKRKPKVAPEVKQESPSTSVPVPDPIPLPKENNKTGEGSHHVSKKPQAARSENPAIPPPIEIQVLKAGVESQPQLTDEERALAEKWFFAAVPRDQWRLKLPLSKDQVFQLRCVMTNGLVPWPRSGSWLANEMRRPV